MANLFIKYTDPKGKVFKIPKEQIDNYMTKYRIDISTAIKMYLDTNNLQEDKELTQENKESGAYKVTHQAEAKRPRKVREAKISDEKTAIFEGLKSMLPELVDACVVKTENKMFVLKKGDLYFKLDLSQCRTKPEGVEIDG